MYHEVNFDGLIGPTHNYSGLSLGNLASRQNAHLVSNPKAAALQGLDKMQQLVDKGYKQGFLLPQSRPDINFLRALGFTGSAQKIINEVAKTDRNLLGLVYSASPMWAANAATVTPSPDTTDHRLHLTPANLNTTPHRSIESWASYQCLNTIFSDPDYFHIHKPLPAHSFFSDEGAANHSRFCQHYGAAGIGMFVYGREASEGHGKFPARQTKQACEAILRQHQLKHNHSILTRQHSTAIDAGAFHNDVVAVANGPVLFHHELAFEPKDEATAYLRLTENLGLKAIKVLSRDVSLEDAIRSYLFNSQLLATPNGDMSSMTLLSPVECAENKAVSGYLEQLIQDDSQPIRHVEFVDVRQSMSNGGGPACLRLRVVMNDRELRAVNQQFILDTQKINQLRHWVNHHYRDQLHPSDLADPLFAIEVATAMERLAELLQLGDYYGSYLD